MAVAPRRGGLVQVETVIDARIGLTEQHAEANAVSTNVQETLGDVAAPFVEMLEAVKNTGGEMPTFAHDGKTYVLRPAQLKWKIGVRRRGEKTVLACEEEMPPRGTIARRWFRRLMVLEALPAGPQRGTGVGLLYLADWCDSDDSMSSLERGNLEQAKPDLIGAFAEQSGSILRQMREQARQRIELQRAGLATLENISADFSS